MDGHIMFAIKLGGNVLTSTITVVIVNDGEFHNITLTRKGRNVLLVLDDSYATRGVVSGGGDLMDISSSEIFFGSDATLQNGFLGCMYGMKLDNRDLPTSDRNDYFIATPSEGGTIQTCNNSNDNFLKVFDSIYIMGGVVLGILILLAVVCVFMNKTCHYCYTKRRNKLTLRSRRDPIFSPVNPIAINRTSFRRSLSFGGDHSFLRTSNSFEHLAVIETGEVQTGHPPSNSNRIHQSSIPPMEELVPTDHLETSRNNNRVKHSPTPSPVKVPIPQYRDTATSSCIPVEASRIVSPTNVTPVSIKFFKTKTDNNRLSVVSLDPMTGMPVCAESESDKHSITNVRSYIMDRVKDVDHELLDDNYDELETFSEEGPYIPLGSIGSLYDIIQEEEEVRIFKMECQSTTSTKYDQNSPSPLLSSYSRSPTKSRKHKTHVSSISPKVAPKILRKAIPSKKRHVDSEKQLLMRQLMGVGNPLAELNYETQQQAESEFV